MIKTLALSIAFTAVTFAQTPVQPSLPLRVQFQYVPQSLIEWIEGNSTYSFIEASLQKRDIAVTLTEKRGKRTTYCSTQVCADDWKRRGQDAVVTPIDAQIPEKADAGSSFGFGFRDRNGTPILWRFVITYPSSERGAGLNELPQVPIPTLQYRYSGTLAGAGSAVKIGDQLCEAEMWSEVSQPPYFVAYRGAYTEGMDSAMFYPGEIHAGEKQPELTMAGSAVKSAAWADSGHTLLITFNPPLASGAKSTFTIDEGTEKKVASGEAAWDGKSLRLDFRAPSWLKGKSVANTVSAPSN